MSSKNPEYFSRLAKYVIVTTIRIKSRISNFLITVNKEVIVGVKLNPSEIASKNTAISTDKPIFTFSFASISIEMRTTESIGKLSMKTL